MIHKLKTWPEYFREIVSGNKTFEIRRNDRGFAVGDVLVLREYIPETDQYTGREVIKRVGFLLQGELGLEINACCMSLLTPVGVDPDCPNCDGTGGAFPDGRCGVCWEWRGDEVWEHYHQMDVAKRKPGRTRVIK